MSQGQLNRMIHQARQLVAGGGETPSDRCLLERFVRQNDQSAFAELLRRHGGMVLGVCRRILGDVHEAEDAFQATWLVLARKASAVRWSENIGGWLHAAAHRVACKARGRSVRRETHQREFAARAADVPETPDEQIQRLHAEMARLPEKDRAALVLCYLEGKTNAEAAAALQCPLGSMSRRLARAREMLRRRLAHPASPLPAALGGLLESLPPAATTEALQQTTIHAAALVAAGNPAGTAVTTSVTALVEGVLREMFFEKCKRIVLVGVTLGVFTLGLGVLGYQGLATGRPPAPELEQGKKTKAPNQTEPSSRARTFSSKLPLMVYQLVEDDRPKLLGMTGFPLGNVRGATPIAIPAGAVWYVQPMAMAFKMGQGGFAALGGGAGAIGMPAGGLQRGVGAKPAVDFSEGLTGAAVKALAAEMNRQSIPGLSVPNLKMGDDDLAELAKVTGLKTLLLNGVEITDHGLKKLAGFQALRLLALDSTAVSGAGLEHLAKVKRLQTLQLTGKQFGNSALQNLRKAAQLTGLRLNRTAVDGEGLALLKSLTELHTLELCGRFTDVDLKAVRELSSLRRLSLCQTAITDDGVALLKSLKHLESLTLDAYWECDGFFPMVGWSINGAGGLGGAGGFGGGGAFGGAGALGGLAGGGGFGGGGAMNTVKTVKVGDATLQWYIPKQQFTAERKVIPLDPPQFTGKALAHLLGMKQLSSLCVRHAEIKDADVAALGRLAGLKRLVLFAPDVTDKGISALKDLKNLERIDLAGTAMNSGCARTMRELPRLRRLHTNLALLDANSRKKLAEWRRQLPRAKVEPLLGNEGVGGMGGFGIGGGGLGVFGFGGGGLLGMPNGGFAGVVGGTPKKQ